jgi:hypothetical protein
MFKHSLTAMALTAFCTTPAVAKPRGNEMLDLMRALGAGGLTGAALDKAIVEADKSPLGSQANPVRVNMPPGERAYLSRLRCADDKAPAFERGGSTGVGPFGNIVDVYRVTCNDAPSVDIYLDMYFADNETRVVPGFTAK